jgi:hypothetical protein
MPKFLVIEYIEKNLDQVEVSDMVVPWNLGK